VVVEGDVWRGREKYGDGCLIGSEEVYPILSWLTGAS